MHARTWDDLVRCSAGGSLPAFLRHDFLANLERSGCVGRGSGWQPEHLCLFEGERLVAAAPLYRKQHSWGEYVFDWAWADAYERHGLRYYPKLVCAVPFTPVTGPRLLARDDRARSALAEALLAHARAARVSSLHVLFPGEGDARVLEAQGTLLRRGVQFHWRNAGYADFDEFLASLAQPKRKKIRAERRKVRDAGVRFERLAGADITDAHWDFFLRCYEGTYAAHGSTPYLNRGFFTSIGRSMPEQLILVLALRDERPIAASLLVRDERRLYGRYWGEVEHVPCLHFETAYYQAIEAAIELGIEVIEGGAQGEHKMARGFLAEPTRSMHWLAEPAFYDAVDRYLAREGQAIDGYLDELAERSPFRSGAGQPPPSAFIRSTL
ncbi:MAG TPA: GNAT family N-acetyltransferase [Quisquiliibacterium sp.]|nr:GNAT family N-acetyltransferase [Quisquiliibacterium sp.]